MIKIADSHIHIRFCEYKSIVKMLEDISTVGVTDACLMALPYRGACENLAELYTKMNYKKMNVRAFGGLHVTDRYCTVSPEVMAEKLLDVGCDGIKLMFAPELEKYYGMGLNHKYYDKMFSMLEERGTPVNIHLADPENFWDVGGKYHNRGLPSKEQMYEEAFEMLDRHPKLKVTFAHFMFLSNFHDEAVRVLEKYPNLWLDITPGCEMYINFDKELELWHDFFTKYSDRIIFGTDSNTIKTCNIQLENLVYKKLTEKDIFTQNCYGRDFVVNGLSLSDDVVKKICYENYFKRLGDVATVVDTNRFYEYCERVLRDIEKDPVDEYYIKGGELIPDLKKDPTQSVTTNFCKFALGK